MTIRRIWFLAIGGAGMAAAVVLACLGGSPHRDDPGRDPTPYAGSASCRSCHERFHTLWAGSHHALAGQPWSAALARERLTPTDAPLPVGAMHYEVDLADGEGWMVERSVEGVRRYRMAHLLGGKNLIFFLTPLDRGRLQVLPLAWLVGERRWVDTTATMAGHLGGRALSWRDPLLTFNTACYSCHVSQVSSNYDPATRTYRTRWREPGIACETCHGPAAEHVARCRRAAGGPPPRELAILGFKGLTPAQASAACAPCHAKTRPLSQAWRPGERFFDHFDLVGLESEDYHPDGRDRGENQTWTLWLTNPCARSGKLGCLHCHTASGRFRHREEPDAACLPCHAERVADAAAHHRHPAGGPGSRCIDCHMPKTVFARMTRSDHSHRPPTPAATLAFGSPNACTLCHRDKGAAWADKKVRTWHPRDHQRRPLHRARLIADARRGAWSRLEAMLAFVADRRSDPVFVASLVRLLATCPDPRRHRAFLSALRSPSPLVRAAGAEGVGPESGPDSLAALLAATGDPYRLVRIRAAASLAPLERAGLLPADRHRLVAATGELVAALGSRPDQWNAHFNLGNHHTARGELRRALAAYAQATRLRPDAVPPLVNAAQTHARLGETGPGERLLQRALTLDATNAAAHFNLGLLLAGRGERPKAVVALRAALAHRPDFAAAAYNLGLLLVKDRPAEGLRHLLRADRMAPGTSRTVYTIAFYQHQQGATAAAVERLEQALAEDRASADIYHLLGSIHLEQDRPKRARRVYTRALADRRLTGRDKALFRARLHRLREAGTGGGG